MAAVNINTVQFNQLRNGNKPVLVDYWAPWCSYCRRITTAYDKIAQQFGEAVEVVKINIDDEAALAEQEKIEVIPTLVLYREGKALASVVAPESKAAIENFLRENLDL